MAGQVSFGGLSSGLDTASIVSTLVKVARAPITRLENQRTLLTTQKNTIAALKSLMQTVQSKAASLDTRREFMAHTATADTDVVKVAAGGDANPGSFSLTVSTLAAAQRTYSTGVASKSVGGLFGAGDVSVTVGSGTPVSLTVDANTTLESFAADINAQVDGANASVLFDGTNYRLQVVGESTGAANAISFVENGTSLGLDIPANTVQAATDASFSIDGFSMSRSTNVVNDALPGLTFELRQVSADASGGGKVPTTVTIDRDAAALETRVRDFVTAYNDVQKRLYSEFSFSGVVDQRKLQGDGTLHGLQRDLAKAITSPVSGLSVYSSLASLGIASQRDGTLAIDATKLASAIKSDPEAVAKLFVSDTGAGRVGLAERLDSLADSYVDFADGRLVQREAGLVGRLDSIGDEIIRQQSRIDAYEARLNVQFGRLEQTLSDLQSSQNFVLNSSSFTTGSNNR